MGEDRGGIHGGVEGQFVPAEELERGWGVGVGVGDAALG